MGLLSCAIPHLRVLALARACLTLFVILHVNGCFWTQEQLFYCRTANLDGFRILKANFSYSSHEVQSRFPLSRGDVNPNTRGSHTKRHIDKAAITGAIFAFVHVTRRSGRSNTLMVFAVGPYTCAPLRPADKLPPASGRILVFRRLQAARE